MTGDARLVVDGLSVCRVDTGEDVVKDVSFALRAGELLGLVGESGAGKTTVGLALLGYARRGLRISAGRVTLDGLDILSLPAARLREIRGARVAYVPQDPASALNPVLKIGPQLSEVFSSHPAAIPNPGERLAEVLSDVGLDGNMSLLKRYPHQLSGGQQQRVAIAMAFACRPEIVVADEPTTGLDVSTQRRVLDTLRMLCDRYGVAGLYVSHDLAVVSELVTDVAVMHDGSIVERGPAKRVFSAPEHGYTRSLIAAARPAASVNGRGAATDDSQIVRIAGLHACFGDTEVLTDIDIGVPKETCLAVVGESGAGKTTLARCLVGLHRDWRGEASFAGELLDPIVRRRSRAAVRGIRYVFQNPYASLNPRKTIEQIVARPLEGDSQLSRADVKERVGEALVEVALDRRFLTRYPDQLSGGERQRVAIARALVVGPELLVCDEVTSALDVSVQAVIVELLMRLQRERRLSILFVTHNIELVRSIAQSVVVLLDGRVVESGSVDQVLNRPTHAYTRRLIEDVPTLRRDSALRGA